MAAKFRHFSEFATLHWSSTTKKNDAGDWGPVNIAGPEMNTKSRFGRHSRFGI